MEAEYERTGMRGGDVRGQSLTFDKLVIFGGTLERAQSQA